MKATKEMAEKLYFAMNPEEEDVTEAEIEEARQLLETALADVPELSFEASEYRRLWGKCMDSRLAACKAHEAAEAKLAKVREWELLNNGIHNAAWRDLVEILDGEL